MSEEIHDEIGKLHERIAQLEGRLERICRPGTIVDDADIDVSDPSKPRARIQVGVKDDGSPKKGPFVPYTTIAGARNQHNPPSKGQQFLHLSPDGDFEQGLLVPLGHSDNVQAPSTDLGTYVDAAGQTDVRFKDGKHQVKAGDKTLHLITTDGQRIQVDDITKLVIKIGDTPYNLKMDALQAAQDIPDF